MGPHRIDRFDCLRDALCAWPSTRLVDEGIRRLVIPSEETADGSSGTGSPYESSLEDEKPL